MSTSNLSKLKSVINRTFGTSWHRVNLHVHAKGNDPDEIVSKAILFNMSLIAIADHNTFAYVEQVQNAAKKIKEKELVVLPGIEITLVEVNTEFF